jgi:hypothetical protein
MMPTNQPQIPTFAPSDLQQDSKTLFYELEALYETAAGYKALNDRPGTRETVRWPQNAHVESFGIHCRALIVFFSGESGYRTDVSSTHFGFARGSFAISRALWDAKTQADKQIAHITTERRGLNQTPANAANWRLDELLTELCDLTEKFLNGVNEQNLAPGMKRKFGSVIQKSRGLFTQQLPPAAGVPNVARVSAAGIYPGLQARTAPLPRDEDGR